MQTELKIHRIQSKKNKLKMVRESLVSLQVQACDSEIDSKYSSMLNNYRMSLGIEESAINLIPKIKRFSFEINSNFLANKKGFSLKPKSPAYQLLKLHQMLLMRDKNGGYRFSRALLVDDSLNYQFTSLVLDSTWLKEQRISFLKNHTYVKKDTLNVFDNQNLASLVDNNKSTFLTKDQTSFILKLVKDLYDNLVLVFYEHSKSFNRFRQDSSIQFTKQWQYVQKLFRKNPSLYLLRGSFTAINQTLKNKDEFNEKLLTCVHNFFKQYAHKPYGPYIHGFMWRLEPIYHKYHDIQFVLFCDVDYINDGKYEFIDDMKKDWNKIVSEYNLKSFISIFTPPLKDIDEWTKGVIFKRPKINSDIKKSIYKYQFGQVDYAADEMYKEALKRLVSYYVYINDFFPMQYVPVKQLSMKSNKKNLTQPRIEVTRKVRISGRGQICTRKKIRNKPNIIGGHNGG